VGWVTDMAEADEPPSYVAEFVDQTDPQIGDELVHVRFADGTAQEFRLHDYVRVYALPGLYEQLVQDRLECRSPQQVAAILAEAVDEVGWDRERVRAMDIAAGNGVSGEALAAVGLRPFLGSDIVPAARAAALRDRPGLYDCYLTLDLLALSDGDRTLIRGMGADVLSCVAPVGEHALPAEALAAAAALLKPDALVSYLHDVEIAGPDPVTVQLWRERLGAGVQAEELIRRRYVHRRLINGAPYEMEAVVWRLRRSGSQAQ
jgi:hypothetical protein